MNTKTITVTSVEWPAAGKKMGAIIDNEGQRWGVWPDKLSGYQQFRTYEIAYKSNDYKGKTYYTIETARPLNGTGTVTGLIVPKPAPPRHEESFDDKRRMDIYICGAVNNMLSNPSVNPMEITTTQIAELTRKAMQAWKLTLGPQAQAVLPSGALDDEMNDGIPFR